MLTSNALIEQAKLRNMPPTKIRGILREYLQVLILKELYKTEAGRKLYFTGGTYLRLIHNLKRFSEDLDFNTSSIRKTEFENLIARIQTELKRTAIECRLAFKHWENIYAAHLIFPEIEKAYGAVSTHSKKEGLILKIETNQPSWKIQTESKVVSGFGEIYPCICTTIGALFADKIDALNKKTRARHLYDVIFMLSNHFPIDKRVLSQLGVKKDPLAVIPERVMSFSKAELKKQAESLRPFLFEESEAEWLTNAHQILPALIKNYRG